MSNLKLIKSLTNLSFAISFLVVPTPIFAWPHVVALAITAAGFNYRRYLQSQEKQAKIQSENRLEKIENEIRELTTALTFKRN